MLILYMALLAIACKPAPVECLCPEDFVDKWWQIETSNCYLFAADGHIVESDGTDNWPIGQWELEYRGECQYSIITEDAEIKVLGLDECLEIEYEGNQYSACECSL
jgi:hypothetical protein